MTEQVIPFTLNDPMLPDFRVSGTIVVRSHSINVRFAGYGTQDMVGDEGAPVWIDLIQQGLTVSVYGDINSEKAVGISLEGARAELYEGPE